MSDLLALILVALAAYRVATDLAWERGPFGAYEELRGAVIGRFGADSWQAEGVTCPVCLSFWVAPAALILWAWAPALVHWLAVAGLVALVVRVRAP